jgi:phosphatidylglycerol---prolipoprotein diacylglyceryl transferase
LLGWEVIPRIGFGNFTISPHGLGIALGYFAGTMLLAKRARERGFSEDHAWNAAALSVVGAILGARIAYVIGHYSEFDSPLEWLQIYKGGISLIGGLLGGFLAAFLYVRRQKLNFFELTDLGAPGIALGIAIGRIGDLVIGDHLGKATSGWWGWKFKGGELISPPRCIYPTGDGCIVPGMVVHQTALYDMIWSLVIFGLLLVLDKKPRPRGFLTLTWASLYAAGRIATDFTRVDKDWFGLGLTGSQLTSIAALGICSYFLFRQRQLQPAPAGVPAAAPPPAPAPERSVRGSTRRAAQDTVVETPEAPAAEPVLRRRQRAAAATSATTTTEEKLEAQPRRKREAEPSPSQPSRRSSAPPEEAAAATESVFRASRERTRTKTEPEREREPQGGEDLSEETPAGARQSSTTEPSPAEPGAKPNEEPDDDDLDFDWEP